MILDVGEQIGPYIVQQFLGQGGMGFTYKVTQKVSREVQVIKLLPDVATDAKALERARRELASLHRVKSPYVVTGYDLQEYGGKLILAMEHVQGEDLERRVFRRREYDSLADDVQLMKRVLMGLRSVHARGILHRDMKPSNIVVDRGGLPRIIDFGVAWVPGSERVTRGFVGTNYYVAPEYAKTGCATAASDIYSLGVTMYRLFTGKWPKQPDGNPYFHGLEPKSDPIHPSDIARRLPRRVGDVVLRAMAYDPAQRYQSAHVMLRDLNVAVSDSRTVTARMGASRGATRVFPERRVIKGNWFCIGVIEGDHAVVTVEMVEPFGPFQDRDQVLIRRSQVVRFAVDPSASISTISPRMATSLGLQTKIQRQFAQFSSQHRPLVVNLGAVMLRFPGFPELITVDVAFSTEGEGLRDVLSLSPFKGFVLAMDVGSQGVYLGRARRR